MLGDVNTVMNEVKKLQAEVDKLKVRLQGPPQTLDILDTPIIQRLDNLEKRMKSVEQVNINLP
jgi:peptidoglycan hydrolase CwlO-like protein